MKRRFFVRRAARYFLIMLVPTVLLYVILFSNSTDTSTRGFSILASGHSTQRSAATPRSIPVSQNEKSASYLVPFSFENSITFLFSAISDREEQLRSSGQMTLEAAMENCRITIEGVTAQNDLLTGSSRLRPSAVS